MRLNQFIAHSGLTSRRGADQLIEQGKVKVNNQPAKLGQQLTSTDSVTVNGRSITGSSPLEYWLVNKPLGVVSTAHDPQHRPTITSLVKSRSRLYPVGRLDANSTGLTLLTNDGPLTQKLTHPKFHLPKTYLLIVTGQFTAPKLAKLRHGVRLRDGLTAPATVEVLFKNPRKTKLKIILFEGRNRQLRRMCSALRLEVQSLARIALGPLTLANLPLGQARLLTTAEISQLKLVLK